MTLLLPRVPPPAGAAAASSALRHLARTAVRYWKSGRLLAAWLEGGRSDGRCRLLFFL